MKKKQYIEPTLEVVRIDNRVSLMTSSPQGTEIQGEAEDGWEGF